MVPAGQIDEADGPGTAPPRSDPRPRACTLSPALGRLPWTPGLGAPAQDRCHDDKNGAARPVFSLTSSRSAGS